MRKNDNNNNNKTLTLNVDNKVKKIKFRGKKNNNKDIKTFTLLWQREGHLCPSILFF